MKNALWTLAIFSYLIFHEARWEESDWWIGESFDTPQTQKHPKMFSSANKNKINFVPIFFKKNYSLAILRKIKDFLWNYAKKWWPPPLPQSPFCEVFIYFLCQTVFFTKIYRLYIGKKFHKKKHFFTEKS